MSATKKSPVKELLVAVVGLVVALMSAWGMVDRVRLVDVLTLFFGGLAAGVALGSAIAKVRAARTATEG
ncbi:MAG TPA: DUF2759 family protein [Gemmatimonadales bacterium]|nr:DUF2759 family protein [Gemmatimonadales bacterium]